MRGTSPETTAIKRLLDGTSLVLLDEHETVGQRPLRFYYRNGVALNVPLTFSVHASNGMPCKAPTGWAIFSAGTSLDAGPLPSNLKPGDRVQFQRGAIKAAAVGDVLGITCVFMPSGFAVGVPPTAAVPGGFLGGTLGDFAYAGQDERTPEVPFWLPKRRWAEMPRVLGEHGTWQKRLARPDVGCRPTVRRRQQELVAMGVI